jgi:hypothetical protein
MLKPGLVNGPQSFSVRKVPSVWACVCVSEYRVCGLAEDWLLLVRAFERMGCLLCWKKERPRQSMGKRDKMPKKQSWGFVHGWKWARRLKSIVSSRTQARRVGTRVERLGLVVRLHQARCAGWSGRPCLAGQGAWGGLMDGWGLTGLDPREQGSSSCVLVCRFFAKD